MSAIADTGRLDATELHGFSPPAVEPLTSLWLRDRPQRQRRTRRSLTRAGKVVAVVALLDLAALAALGASYTGLLQGRAAASAGGAAAAPAALLRQVGSTPSASSYSVPAAAYQITVEARYTCWVQVTDSHGASFASVMPAGASRSFPLQGHSSVEIGSGGGSLTVQAGGRSQHLVPPAAPYTFNFTGS